MGLPIAIAEGILIALGVLVGGYFALKTISFFGEILVELIEARWRQRRVYGPRMSNYRWYRTDEGKRQLWKELRGFVYVAIGVVIFMAACVIAVLLDHGKT